jgi:hypothetical protein
VLLLGTISLEQKVVCICKALWGTLSCSRVVVGRLDRIAGLGLVMRITLAGMRIRVSVLAAAPDARERNSLRFFFEGANAIGSCSRVVIGRMDRIAGLGHVMRITIAGIRIRISVLAAAPGYRNKSQTPWLSICPCLLGQPKGKIHDGDYRRLVGMAEIHL